MDKKLMELVESLKSEGWRTVELPELGLWQIVHRRFNVLGTGYTESEAWGNLITKLNSDYFDMV